MIALGKYSVSPETLSYFTECLESVESIVIKSLHGPFSTALHEAVMFA